MGKPRPKYRTSKLWKYFTYVDDCFATCNACGHLLSHKHSTTNLKTHLIRRHSDITITESNDNYVTTENNYEAEREQTNALQSVGLMKKPPVAIPTKANPAVENKPKPSPNPVKKKLKTQPANTHMIQEAISILNSFTETVDTVDTNAEEEDEFEQFGKYVATQLRHLPLLNSLEIQEKIYSIITKERIRVMRDAAEHAYTEHSYGFNSQQHNHHNKTIHDAHEVQEIELEEEQCSDRSRCTDNDSEQLLSDVVSYQIDLTSASSNNISPDRS